MSPTIQTSVHPSAWSVQCVLLVEISYLGMYTMHGRIIGGVPPNRRVPGYPGKFGVITPRVLIIPVGFEDGPYRLDCLGPTGNRCLLG